MQMAKALAGCGPVLPVSATGILDLTEDALKLRHPALPVDAIKVTQRTSRPRLASAKGPLTLLPSGQALAPQVALKIAVLFDHGGCVEPRQTREKIPQDLVVIAAMAIVLNRLKNRPVAMPTRNELEKACLWYYAQKGSPRAADSYKAIIKSNVVGGPQNIPPLV
jgi:hypothetical protein